MPCASSRRPRRGCCVTKVGALPGDRRGRSTREDPLPGPPTSTRIASTRACLSASPKRSYTPIQGTQELGGPQPQLDRALVKFGGSRLVMEIGFRGGAQPNEQRARNRCVARIEGMVDEDARALHVACHARPTERCQREQRRVVGGIRPGIDCHRTQSRAGKRLLPGRPRRSARTSARLRWRLDRGRRVAEGVRASASRTRTSVSWSARARSVLSNRSCSKSDFVAVSSALIEDLP